MAFNMTDTSTHIINEAIPTGKKMGRKKSTFIVQVTSSSAWEAFALFVLRQDMKKKRTETSSGTVLFFYEHPSFLNTKFHFCFLGSHLYVWWELTRYNGV